MQIAIKKNSLFIIKEQAGRQFKKKYLDGIKIGSLPKKPTGFWAN